MLKIDNVSFSYDNSKNNCNLADINQNIEKGENDLQIDRCIKLSKYFDVSTDYILKGEVSDCREFQLYFESLSGREKKREFDILLNKTFSK